MKKVLTLMGALSVAGSAIAHDYLWNMSDLSGEVGHPVSHTMGC